MKRNKITFHALAIALTVVPLLCSCENIDEVPPINESTTNKVYRIPDPVPMTAADVAEYNAIKAEYDNSTTSTEMK